MSRAACREGVAAPPRSGEPVRAGPDAVWLVCRVRGPEAGSAALLGATGAWAVRPVARGPVAGPGVGTAPVGRLRVSRAYGRSPVLAAGLRAGPVVVMGPEVGGSGPAEGRAGRATPVGAAHRFWSRQGGR